LAPGIQESRSYFRENRCFFEKCPDLGVDVIQPRSGRDFLLFLLSGLGGCDVC